MSKKYRLLAVSKEAHDLVRKQCKEEFLRYHPEHKGKYITDDQIVLRIANFYLNPRG